MTDELLRGMTRDGFHRVFVARTTDTAAEANTRHQLLGVPAVALARGITSVLLAAATDPEWFRVSGQWVSRGPLGTMHVDVRRSGDLRGYVNLAENALDAVGKPLEDWVRPGVLVAMRQEPSGRFSQSQVAIGRGSVDHDVETYLRQSEQVASTLRVLSSHDAFGSPVDVVGVLVQTLPGGDPGKTILPDPIGQRLRAPDGPLEALMQEALPGTEIDLLETTPLRFQCGCDRSRVEMSVRLLGASDLRQMIAVEEATSVRCEFCATDYVVSVPDLARILAGLEEHPIGEA